MSNFIVSAWPPPEEEKFQKVFFMLSTELKAVETSDAPFTVKKLNKQIRTPLFAAAVRAFFCLGWISKMDDNVLNFNSLFIHYDTVNVYARLSVYVQAIVSVLHVQPLQATTTTTLITNLGHYKRHLSTKFHSCILFCDSKYEKPWATVWGWVRTA